MHKVKSVISNVKNIILEWCINLNNNELSLTDTKYTPINNNPSVVINHVGNFNVMGDNAQITNIISFKGEIKDNLNEIQNILNSQNINEDIKKHRKECFYN